MVVFIDLKPSYKNIFKLINIGILWDAVDNKDNMRCLLVSN
jgi:hypothetical protein